MFDQIKNDPIYQFKQDQANKTLNNQMAARGLLGGGANTKAATDLSLQLAGTEVNDKWNRLASLVNTGMGYSMPQQGTSSAMNLGNLYQTGGQDIASSLQNAANQRSGLYSGLGQASNAFNTGNANALAGFYGANSNNGMNLAGWQLQQPNTWTQLGSLANAYGSGAFGGSRSWNPFVLSNKAFYSSLGPQTSGAWGSGV
jgi:hypothetical protein